VVAEGLSKKPGPAGDETPSLAFQKKGFSSGSTVHDVSKVNPTLSPTFAYNVISASSHMSATLVSEKNAAAGGALTSVPTAKVAILASEATHVDVFTEPPFSDVLQGAQLTLPRRCRGYNRWLGTLASTQQPPWWTAS
jgi:hypothetical protein